jgi:hypothetical protein
MVVESSPTAPLRKAQCRAKTYWEASPVCHSPKLFPASVAKLTNTRANHTSCTWLVVFQVYVYKYSSAKTCIDYLMMTSLVEPSGISFS